MVNPPKKDDEQGYRHDLGHQQFSRSSLQSLPMVVNQRFTHQFRVQTPSLVLKSLWNPIFFPAKCLVFGCFWYSNPQFLLLLANSSHGITQDLSGSPLAEGNCRQTSGSDTGKPRTMEQLTLAGKTARYQMLSISIPHYSNSLTQRPEILGDSGMLLCTFCFYQRPKAAGKKHQTAAGFHADFHVLWLTHNASSGNFSWELIHSKSTELEMSIHNTWARMRSYPGETSLNAPPEK